MKYTEAEIRTITFEAEDVIATSGNAGGGGSDDEGNLEF